MKKLLLAAAAPLFLSACGPDETPSLRTLAQEAKCEPSSNCDPEEPTYPPPPSSTTYFLTLNFWNQLNTTRNCWWSYSYTSSTGAYVSSVIYDNTFITANSQRIIVATIPNGTAVTVTGGCSSVMSTTLELAIRSTSVMVDGNRSVTLYYNVTASGAQVTFSS